jgi:hypothetical protein
VPEVEAAAAAVAAAAALSLRNGVREAHAAVGRSRRSSARRTRMEEGGKADNHSARKGE